MITESYSMYNAAFTAFYNVNRPKRKKALKLWKKAKVKKADMEIIHENMKVIHEVEEKEGRGWVDAIYKANSIPLSIGGV